MGRALAKTHNVFKKHLAFSGTPQRLCSKYARAQHMRPMLPHLRISTQRSSHHLYHSQPKRGLQKTVPHQWSLILKLHQEVYIFQYLFHIWLKKNMTLYQLFCIVFFQGFSSDITSDEGQIYVKYCSFSYIVSFDLQFEVQEVKYRYISWTYEIQIHTFLLVFKANLSKLESDIFSIFLRLRWLYLHVWSISFVPGRDSAIVQIAAVSGDKAFSEYILPDRAITPGASDVTGITVVNNQLYYNGNLVHAVDPRVGLSNFLSFLEQFKNPVLVAHNCFNFDSRVLYHNLKKYDLYTWFCTLCIGFCDTLPMVKKAFPESKSFKQESLANDVLGKSYNAHNAVDDCEMLKEIVSKATEAGELLLNYSCTPSYISDCITYCAAKNSNRPSFNKLVQEKVMSNGVAQRLSGSGLQFSHIMLAHERSGLEGIQNLLNEKDKYNKARFLRSKSLSVKLHEHIVKSVIATWIEPIVYYIFTSRTRHSYYDIIIDTFILLFSDGIRTLSMVLFWIGEMTGPLCSFELSILLLKWSVIVWFLCSKGEHLCKTGLFLESSSAMYLKKMIKYL